MAEDYRIEFRSLTNEVSNQNLNFTGKKIPDYLNGTLLRNGPALFELKKGKFKHLFDGLAMIHAFQFGSGKVVYTNKFLRSEDYKKSITSGEISFTEFATAPDRNIFEKMIVSLYPPFQFGGNASINFMKMKDKWNAIFDVPTPIAFNLNTLETIGENKYSDHHLLVINSPHPMYDPVTEEYINFGVDVFPFMNSYKIFRIKKGKSEREVFATIPVDKPAYMHSFAMTEKYIILSEHPLLVNELGMITMAVQGKAIIDSFNWTPEAGTRFIIVDRKTGKLKKTIKMNPFFIFHHLNAYDEGNEIVIDIAAYESWNIISELYLENLLSENGANTETSVPFRFRVNLETGSVSKEIIVEETIELPVINFERNLGRHYNFVYGTSNNKNVPADFLNQLIKINVQTKEVKTWFSEKCYPQEPCFVPKPGGREDEGVLLSVIADAKKEKSFLLILDAENFTEIGRADIPHLIPFGLHGVFVPR